MSNSDHVRIPAAKSHAVTWAGAALLVSLVFVGPALAGGPAGTISCDVSSVPVEPPRRPFPGFVFAPSLSDEPRTIETRAANNDSTCDASAVTGAKVPITGVLFALKGTLPSATCSSFLGSTGTMVNGEIRMRWLGLNPAGYPRTVGASRATIEGFSYDENSGILTITTGSIAKGAFAGDAATLALQFDAAEAADISTKCEAGVFEIAGIRFGLSNLTVQ